MPKDTKGHGSNKRSGAFSRSPSGPVIIGTSTTHYGDNGQTFHRVHYSNGQSTESPNMGTHMQALFDRARREGAPHEVRGDVAAATELAKGSQKSDAVPIHSGTPHSSAEYAAGTKRVRPIRVHGWEK